MRFAVPVAAMILSVLMTISASAHQDSLEGSEWGVVGESGPTARFISFAGSGRVFGFGGCNRFTGTYVQNDHELTISPLATTRMACPEDIMAKEAEFLDLLGKVRGTHVDHTVLLLLDEAGADLRALMRRDPD